MTLNKYKADQARENLRMAIEHINLGRYNKALARIHTTGSILAEHIAKEAASPQEVYDLGILAAKYRIGYKPYSDGSAALFLNDTVTKTFNTVEAAINYIRQNYDS